MTPCGHGVFAFTNLSPAGCGATRTVRKNGEAGVTPAKTVYMK